MGKTLIINPTGLGNTIQFYQYFPLVKDGSRLHVTWLVRSPDVKEFLKFKGEQQIYDLGERRSLGRVFHILMSLRFLMICNSLLLLEPRPGLLLSIFLKIFKYKSRITSFQKLAILKDDFPEFYSYQQLLDEASITYFPYTRPQSLTYSGKKNNKIGINIGAGANFKKLSNKQWLKVAILLSKSQSTELCIFGGSTESDDVKKLAQSMEANGICHRVYINESFSALTKIFNTLDLLVSNDSGLAHFACSLNLPTVVIFGPTSSLKNAWGLIEHNLYEASKMNDLCNISSNTPCNHCLQRVDQPLCLAELDITALCCRILELSNGK